MVCVASIHCTLKPDTSKVPLFPLSPFHTHTHTHTHTRTMLQWLNQSHNACVNYANRNASKVTTSMHVRFDSCDPIAIVCQLPLVDSIVHTSRKGVIEGQSRKVEGGSGWGEGRSLGNANRERRKSTPCLKCLSHYLTYDPEGFLMLPCCHTCMYFTLTLINNYYYWAEDVDCCVHYLPLCAGLAGRNDKVHN